MNYGTKWVQSLTSIYTPFCAILVNRACLGPFCNRAWHNVSRAQFEHARICVGQKHAAAKLALFEAILADLAHASQKKRN